jgi:ferritin-like metal-binding protein YciE
MTQAANLLKQTLAEEEKTDKALSGLAKGIINQKAA